MSRIITPRRDLILPNRHMQRGFIINPYRFASSHGGSNLRSGMLHWWALGEASGNRADSHGSLGLVASGTVTNAPAAIGNGSSTSSSASNRLNSTTSDNLSSTSFTVAGVFKTSNANYGIVCRNSQSTAAASRQWLALIESGVFYFTVSTSGTTNAAQVTAGSGLGDNGLHTFIAWRDTAAGTINAQIDGGAVQSTAFSGATALYSAVDPGYTMHAIGNIYPGGVNDEIAIWNRVLTADERTWLHNGGAWRAYADTA